MVSKGPRSFNFDTDLFTAATRLTTPTFAPTRCTTPDLGPPGTQNGPIFGEISCVCPMFFFPFSNFYNIIIFPPRPPTATRQTPKLAHRSGQCPQDRPARQSKHAQNTVNRGQDKHAYSPSRAKLTQTLRKTLQYAYSRLVVQFKTSIPMPVTPKNHTTASQNHKFVCVFPRFSRYLRPSRPGHKTQQFDQTWAHFGPSFGLSRPILRPSFGSDLSRSRRSCCVVWTSSWADLTATSPIWSNCVNSNKHKRAS